MEWLIIYPLVAVVGIAKKIVSRNNHCGELDHEQTMKLYQTLMSIYENGGKKV